MTLILYFSMNYRDFSVKSKLIICSVFFFFFFFFFYGTMTLILYFSMNYRDFSVKLKLIISLFPTSKLSFSISLFQKIGFL